MKKELQFGILRNEQQKFSSLSPSLQKLFNKGVREKILRQEAEEAEPTEQKLERLEDEEDEVTNEELDSLLEDVGPEEAKEIISALDALIKREEDKELGEKEEELEKAGIPSQLRTGRGRRRK